ncbi:MAG: twin-arginine translocase TatA/TatE family subunit [Bdellovibrionales bacterium]|nr:twin-arginine translocase TatA/TatE family subunit [Bdellovibrionales bacterium]
MFSIGILELLIICALALVILGPEKFPKLAKELARLIHQLRSVKDDVQKQVSSINDEASAILQKKPSTKNKNDKS